MRRHLTIVYFISFFFNQAFGQAPRRDFYQVMLDAGTLYVKDCHAKDKSTASLNETISWLENKINRYYKTNYSETNDILYETRKGITITNFKFRIVNKALEINITKEIEETSYRRDDVMNPLPRVDKKNYMEGRGFKIPIEKLDQISWHHDILSFDYFDNNGFDGKERFSIHILEQEPDLKQRMLKAFCHLHKLLFPKRREAF